MVFFFSMFFYFSRPFHFSMIYFPVLLAYSETPSSPFDSKGMCHGFSTISDVFWGFPCLFKGFHLVSTVFRETSTVPPFSRGSLDTAHFFKNDRANSLSLLQIPGSLKRNKGLHPPQTWSLGSPIFVLTSAKN